VDRCVIPGWHHFPGFALGRVPKGGDVIVRTLEHDEAFVACCELVPLWVRAGEMRVEGAVFGCLGIDQEWNRVCHGAARACGHQEPERMRTDESVLQI
jgi:hypothetical protein